MPEFSVVIPIYKVEKYLEKAIDSVLAQTFGDFELILVDDGSPDGCPKICDDYANADERIRVLHKVNGGVISARHAGTELARGAYVVYVDGDDWIHQRCLEKMYEVIKSRSPDIICCGYYVASEGEQRKVPLNVPFGEYDKERISNVLYPVLIESEDGRYFSPQIWAKAFRLDLYKKYELVKGDFAVGEDHACTKPCIFHARSMFMMEECLYYYRQNFQSVTNLPKPFRWEGPRQIGQHFEQYIDMEVCDFRQQVYRSVVHNLFNVVLSQFNQKKPYGAIKQEILNHLSDEYYQQAIENCKYKHSFKGEMARMALKFRLVWLIFLYNRVRTVRK